MHMSRVENESRGVAGCRKARRYARGELGRADAHARKTRSAEIVDALDGGRQQAGCRRGDVDKFRPHADLDLRSLRQHTVIAVQADDMAIDPRLPAIDLGGYDV